MNIKVQPTIQPETLAWYKSTFKKPTGVMGDVLESVANFGDKHPGGHLFESPLDCLDHALTTNRAMMQQGRRLLKGIFTADELTAIVLVMNETALTHSHPGATLQGNIGDALTHELPVEIDQQALIQKVSALGIFERSYLEFWAWAFWYSPGFDDRELDQYIKQLL